MSCDLSWEEVLMSCDLSQEKNHVTCHGKVSCDLL